jgi:hypothetical protein
MRYEGTKRAPSVGQISLPNSRRMRCDNSVTMFNVEEMSVFRSRWIYQPVQQHIQCAVEPLHQVRKTCPSLNQYYWHIVALQFNYLIARSSGRSIVLVIITVACIWTRRWDGQRRDQTVVHRRAILDEVFLYLPEIPMCYLKSGHNRFLPHCLILIIYQSPYHMMCCSINHKQTIE